MSAVVPLVWMRALRDHPDVGKGRLVVLVMLALRMRKDGTGWAVQRQLARDARVSEATVYRALRWAQTAGYLERTRRGHRIKDGHAVGSEYRLTLPTQPVTRDGLGRGAVEKPTSHFSTQPVKTATQPVTRDGLRGLSSRGLLTRVPSFDGSTPNGDDRHNAPIVDPEAMKPAARAVLDAIDHKAADGDTVYAAVCRHANDDWHRGWLFALMVELGVVVGAVGRETIEDLARTSGFGYPGHRAVHGGFDAYYARNGTPNPCDDP